MTFQDPLGVRPSVVPFPFIQTGFQTYIRHRHFAIYSHRVRERPPLKQSFYKPCKNVLERSSPRRGAGGGDRGRGMFFVLTVSVCVR